MQGQNSVQTTTKQRIKKLQTERALEVKRDGIPLRLNRTEYEENLLFSFNQDDYYRLTALIQQEKYGLQICLENGNAVMTLMQHQIFDINYKSFMVMCSLATGRLDPLRPYCLMKQNASNSIHKSMLYNASSNAITDYIEEKASQVPAPQRVLRFPYQQDMNQSQNQALKKVGQNSLVFIKGPPGCGKTKTIARICKLLYQQKKKVIVGTVSNTGNLSILSEIIKEMIPEQSQLWIQHFINNMYFNPNTCFMLQDQQKHVKPKIVLLTILQTTEQNSELQPVFRYFSLNNWVIRNMWNLNYDQDMTLIEFLSCMDFIANKNRRSEGVLRKVFSLYKQALKKTISEADILITTTVLSASIHQRAGDQPFRPDVAILDEASQATWADTYCYLQFPIQRMVLVGDDKQLDPTVISQDKLLKQTVFAKMCHRKPQYFVMLDTQYRMHPQISEFPNLYFYDNQLKNGVTAQQRSNNIEYFSHHPLSFINHSVTQQYTQDQQNGKKNYYNEEQIRIIRVFLTLFPIEELKNVGIISPYSLQVKKLSEAFQIYVKNGLTIKSCDGYQGGEKDFIIISCVRSNDERRIGFCGQKNRINVSLTRAKKALLIVGNAYTLSWCSQLQISENIWHHLIGFLHSKQRVFDEQSVVDYLMKYHEQRVLQNPSPALLNYIHNEAKLHEDYHDPIEEKKKREQKQEQRVQRLIQLLQTINAQGRVKKGEQYDQNEELQRRNKKVFKEIRKYIQAAAKNAEKPSLQQFKNSLKEKFTQSFSKNEELIDLATRGVQQQALLILHRLRSQAVLFAEHALDSSLNEAIEYKEQRNHLKTMQVCGKVLRKTVTYYLISLFL